jgi:hypothetical protein
MAAATAYSNWGTISGLFSRAVTDAPGPIYGYYVQHIFQMKDQSGAFSDRERGLTGVHWMNTTGGDLDVTWTAADFALVEAGFGTLWSSLAAYIPDEVRLVEHRWYAYGPGVVATRANPQPPARVTAVTPTAGSVVTRFPHQVAETITFQTTLRRHWGRMYIPVAATGTSITPGGEWGTTMVDAFANAGSAYIKSGNANGLTPVIWDRVHKVALGITAVEADSVPDIIRRRRPRGTTYRKTLTA